MAQKDSLLTKIRDRLKHLNSMPETPFRRREILSLERTLAQAPKEVLQASAEKKPAPRRKRSAQTPEPKKTKPARQVERTSTHRKITIRPKASAPAQDEETPLDKRERKDRMGAFRSVLDGYHRGMS